MSLCRTVGEDRPCRVCGETTYCAFIPRSGWSLCFRVRSHHVSTNPVYSYIHYTKPEDDVTFSDVLAERSIVITQDKSDIDGATALGLFAAKVSGTKVSIEYMKDWLLLNRYIRDVIYLVTGGNEKVIANLQKSIQRRSAVWYPPCNLKDYAESGGTKESLHSSLNDLIWNNPE